MPHVERRSPRVPFEHPGELEVLLLGDAENAVKRITVPITIQSISPEGVGVIVDGKGGILLARGDDVVVKFTVDRQDMEIPGQIAWYRPDTVETGCDVGVALDLDMATAAQRHGYATWVGQLLRARVVDVGE